MRARNVKPGVFKNELLATSDPLHLWIFEGLWCMADREGRLEDRPRRIHLEINPGRAYEGTEAALAWLAENGFIVRYSHGSGQYIQVVNFAKHQNPHVREPASTIPPPSASTELAPDNSAHINESKSETSTIVAPGSHQSGPALSPFPFPDSPSHMAAARPSVRTRFADFWAVYPKKVKRRDAEKVWQSKRLDGMADVLIADVKRRQSEDRRWLGGFVCDPPVYLRGERWNDTIEPPAQKNGNGQHAADTAAKERAQILDLASMFGMELEGDEEWATFKSRVERANERRLANLGRST